VLESGITDSGKFAAAGRGAGGQKNRSARQQIAGQSRQHAPFR